MNKLIAAVVCLLGVVGVYWLAQAGDMEPSGPPAGTMKTLDEIPPSWHQILPADDGDAEGCDSTRFKCVMGGEAVLDLETGLTWARDTNLYGRFDFEHAMAWATHEPLANRYGWRLPSIDELATLLDPLTPDHPKLPVGHPFINVLEEDYWSSTSADDYGYPGHAWALYLEDGHPSISAKHVLSYVWQVRGATNHR